jgi:DNA modification methylase
MATTQQIIPGDCIEGMRTLPDASVHCCVTSPPYWNLRNYNHAGQIGLEATPEAYVARMVEVFREVRRVLRGDGTLWLNLGDTYATPKEGSTQQCGGLKDGDQGKRLREMKFKKLLPPGLKPKDLVGIPWRVAFALQQPYYTGKVQDERDRTWLAAMLDAEGSICGTEYETNNRTKTNLYICITNTSVPIIEKCERLFPQDVKHVYEKTNDTSKRRCFRWDVERIETKAMFLREVYPYLVAKRKQAILGYTFLEMQRGLPSKKKGYLPEQHEQRSWLMAALSRLNAGENVDMPSWAIEPPSLHEPGFYLRQDIIWHKTNPCPESVTDRCTKAHEYVFLLTKSARYFYDAEAVSEAQVTHGDGGFSTKAILKSVVLGASHKPSLLNATNDGRRNRRSVWTISTKPYSGAHFAVMPADLVEPCIKAGCPEQCCPACGKGWERVFEKGKSVSASSENRFATNKKQDEAYCRNDGGTLGNMNGRIWAEHKAANPDKFLGWQPACDCAATGTIPGTVLDPFAGSGTTLAVAAEQGRSGIGCELNPEYIALAKKRIREARESVALFDGIS